MPIEEADEVRLRGGGSSCGRVVFFFLMTPEIIGRNKCDSKSSSEAEMYSPRSSTDEV